MAILLRVWRDFQRVSCRYLGLDSSINSERKDIDDTNYKFLGYGVCLVKPIEEINTDDGSQMVARKHFDV